ncbi:MULTISPECIES: bifunctional phosphopantothenoylcysteine decarboxylase/phosphopantothenate--cysteine ligase CoaBC [unclassified Marinimicrobium]|jgi:phosphopantothenoylcysteine decarboxylase/phosphopantothenate--cysteine ligase|uniref:bifunctional phosphopantothenoylcysteine decarboxylase/phosphopantothenate--cysteine ligase CoaBC n=1 Tax=unclassified Marinimicrobium TaxID=2632100 RepID=UPI000C5EF716|nr:MULTISPECIES: bifunctional phosphopantothenoylcysteine decarboxylase/phosphopantothenate--cysteine ligase CoaBC [unclassified Marinimicrobium]MAN51312.1 bifunctional phosphopantothenoylcysteine decarboxylase/phosphopantothenate--cysteine ligase CoaBC [Marinimicrobium sp.]
MSSLTNKRILLGVTGGIAAYKSAELVRRLKERGADVRVVMTASAREFMTPLTFQALSGNPVHTDLLDPAAEAAMGHIELARWADRILVAPASANFMSRLAEGRGDDLLTTLCLATREPIVLAPAMNQGMWQNPATQANLETLKGRGIHLLGPGDGSQACGEVGPGRMLEPDTLAEAMAAQFATGQLAGRHVVITAGPTREAIDPVRYLSNHSSGKMGYALAEAAVEAGARVTLISGPTGLPTPERVTRIDVTSALKMLEASLAQAPQCDLFIGAAAVADYRPADYQPQKMKKGNEDTLQITLTKNPDIIAAVAQIENRPITIGFAAESEQLLEYARGKRERKGLDAIIANDISREGLGFNSDDNAVTLIDAERELALGPMSKTRLARALIAELSRYTR